MLLNQNRIEIPTRTEAFMRALSGLPHLFNEKIKKNQTATTTLSKPELQFFF
jgi:hypothetical protein